MADRGLIVALPSAAVPSSARLHWWRVEEGVIVARGVRHADDQPEEAEAEAGADAAAIGSDGTLLALIPAGQANIRLIDMGDLAPRQAEVAARLRVAEASMGGQAANHVVTAYQPQTVPARTLAVTVDAGHMRQWLALLNAFGLDPDSVTPASLVLPVPEDGAVRATIADETLLRTRDRAIPDEDVLRDALLGDAEIATLSDVDTDAALVAALAAPPVNLRQGPFAKKRQRNLLGGFDVARLVRMVAVLALFTLAILVVQIVKLHWAASLLESRAVSAAQERFPAVTDLASAEQAVSAEMARRGIGNALFTVPTSGLLASMQTQPNVAIRDLAYSPDGLVTVTMASPQQSSIDQVLIDLQQRGYKVTVPPSVTQDATGNVIVSITVRAP